MRTTAQVLLCLAFILLASQAASAQSNNIYEIRGTADTNIYHINATTGTVTTLFTGYPGGSSATIAQRASDGMLFYAINATDGQVYRYNPATPGVAPVALTSTLGAAVPASFRMAFSPGGTLYYMPDSGVLYTINQVTGVATAGPTVTGIGSGGDMAFNAGGTLYVINSARQLYTAPLAGGAAAVLGTVTFPLGATPATLGLAFDASGVMRVQTQSPSNMYNVSLATFVASNPIAIGGGTTSTGDLANIAVANPDLSITKTNGVTSVYQGGPVSYTIVVTNKTAAYAVTGTVADTVPASVTGVTWTCVASAGSSCAAASGAGNTINTSATLLANGTATYTVAGTVSAGAAGTLTNTATVAPPAFLTDANAADNSATDSDPINVRADLSVTKTDGVATITAGGAVTYTIAVKSAATSTGASNGSIVTDTVPATITGVNWTCGSATLGATCGAASGSGNAISTTANLPVGSTLTYTVTGTLSVTATGTLSNTATIITPASGVSDPTDLSRTGAGNNSATDTDAINPVPSVALVKSVSPSGAFQQPGTDLVYTITFTNIGGAAAQNLVIKDPIPSFTDFKVGSVTTSLGTTGLTVTVAYSNDNGSTWTYTPTSGAGGAPAGYDRNLVSTTIVRWTFTGNLSQTSPNNTGSVSFTSRIR
jgi:uncharacterized repeat protein (TIGR01451 family)